MNFSVSSERTKVKVKCVAVEQCFSLLSSLLCMTSLEMLLLWKYNNKCTVVENKKMYFTLQNVQPYRMLFSCETPWLCIPFSFEIRIRPYLIFEYRYSVNVLLLAYTLLSAVEWQKLKSSALIKALFLTCTLLCVGMYVCVCVCVWKIFIVDNID